MIDTVTYNYAVKLREAGVKAIAVGVDSYIQRERDLFRGKKGGWERTMKGIENIRRLEGRRYPSR